MNNLLQAFTNEQLKTEIPVVNVGDTIRIHNRIKEGNRERIQMFEGTVIAKHGGGQYITNRICHCDSRNQ